MSRLLWLTILLAATLGALPAAAEIPIARVTLSDDLAAISRFYPRQEGSPAEKELIAWIEARLSSLSVPYSPFDFSQSDFQHSFSSCLRVDLPGRTRDTLIVAVPIDGPLGAEQGRDGSLSVALALDLINAAKAGDFPVSLTVLFLGAEYGEGDAYPMGSTLFLRDFQPDYRTAVVYLKLLQVPSRVLVRGGGRGIVSPYWLMSRSMDALRDAKVPFLLRGDEAQVFRMGTTNERTLIEPWLQAGYPSVGLEGEYRDVGDTEARITALSGSLRGFLTASGSGIPETWDRHYLLLQIAGVSLIISEGAYVAMVLGILALTLLYSLIFRRGLKKYLRILLRKAWAILPLAFVSFLFLLAGTAVMLAILSLRGFPALWTFAPLPFLALKVCIGLFLYAILYNVFRRLPFPRNGSFYSAAALFFLLIDITVVAAFNISFTYYFLWAYVFVFLSALARNRYAKLLLFLPAPLWGLRELITVFMAPAVPFWHFLLLSPLTGNLLVAGVSLPFIVGLLRLGLLFPGRGILRRRVREFIIAGVMLAATGGLCVYLFTWSPYSASSPQSLAAVQVITVDTEGKSTATTLQISSPAPLGALSVTDTQGERSMDPAGTSLTVPMAATESPVQVSTVSRQFLQQRNVTVTVSMPSSPQLMTATLSAPDDFVLLDSSFPAVREGPRSYRLLIGAFPPNPLPLQLSLPADGTFTLVLTMQFDTPLIGAAVAGGPNARVVPHVRVVRRLEVKT
ncbi:MAG: hypothetical protein ABSG63_06830 [Spirochaetia bacterium]|jgi:hypothetical protein